MTSDGHLSTSGFTGMPRYGAIMLRSSARFGLLPTGQSSQKIQSYGLVPAPAVGKRPLLLLQYIMNACPTWRKLDRHLSQFACSRARLSDGSRMEISSAI